MDIQCSHMKTGTGGGDSSRKRQIYANPYCIPVFFPDDVAKYLADFDTKENGIIFDLKSYTKF